MNANSNAFPIHGHPFSDKQGGFLNPFEGYGWLVDPQSGLTKRELFAAMAIQGLASIPVFGTETYDVVVADAARAVRYADALLAALDAEAKCERLRMQGKSQDDYAATCAGPPVDMVRDTL